MKKIAIILFVLMGIVLSIPFSCRKGKNNPSACNGSSTRREIKLASDVDASEIDTSAILIGVKAFGELDAIEAKKETPRQEVEKKVFTIRAVVDKVSKHWDGDWKVKLKEDDFYVNCEFPNPGCEFAQQSLFFSEIKSTRKWIEENEANLVGKTVTITGIAFIDLDHKYPRKTTNNELELHPVLKIEF